MISKYRQNITRFAWMLGISLSLVSLAQFVLISVKNDQISALMLENSELKASLGSTEEKIGQLVSLQSGILDTQQEIETWFKNINKNSFAKFSRFLDSNNHKLINFASNNLPSSSSTNFRLGRLELLAQQAHYEADLLLNKTRVIKDFMVRIPSLAPAQGYISSPFGPRRDPLNKKRSIHHGIDIVGLRGSDVLAPANGRVKTAKYSRTFGKMIEIEHGDLISRFGHLQEILVKNGDSVKQGQIIGKVGNSGLRSTATHLHYEIRDKNNKSLDPTQFMVMSSLQSPFF